MTIRGGGDPSPNMVQRTVRLECGPPPRSLAAEANGCFMVGTRRGSNRIQGCGAILRAKWQAPSVRTAATATEIRSRQNRPAATNQLDIDIPIQEWAHRLGASPLKRMAASWSGPDAGPTEYKVAARYYAQNGRLPSVRTAATATEIRSRQNRPAATNQLDIDIPIQVRADQGAALAACRLAGCCTGFAERFERLAQGELNMRVSSQLRVRLRLAGRAASQVGNWISWLHAIATSKGPVR